jgi:hypothetical protein
MTIVCGVGIGLWAIGVGWLLYELRRAPLVDENGNVIEEKKS